MSGKPYSISHLREEKQVWSPPMEVGDRAVVPNLRPYRRRLSGAQPRWDTTNSRLASPVLPFPPIYQQMDIDPVLGTLLLLLGAQISYVLDEILALTPRVSSWLDRFLG